MKHLTLLVPAALAFLPLANLGYAYEIGTHAKITEEAYKRSILGVSGSNKLAQLGLLDLTGIVGKNYLEFRGTETLERRQFQYERDVMFNAVFNRIADDDKGKIYSTFPYRPVGWMVTGAIREDDGQGSVFMADGIYRKDPNIPNPSEVLSSDVPMGGHFNRFCNHFYDPKKARTANGNDNPLSATAYTDIGSNIGCQQQASPNIAAAAWALALKTNTSIFAAAEDLQSRVNHFAISDAKEAMWRAATGYESTMTTKVAPLGTERMKYWASVFRTLGGVTHLLQDMAQAQHTRNEGHPFGVRHTYEKYVEWRTAESSNAVTFDATGKFAEPTNEQAEPWPTAMWSSYPIIPTFSKYEHYWHAPTGLGLAVYSNEGFLTPGKNIGNTEYSLPPSDATNSAYTPSVASEMIDEQPVNVTRLKYAVPDALTGGADTIPMARKNTLHWLTTVRGAVASTNKLYGPDIKIYDAQASLQLPRAVAYSAGLINHFFRGQLRIEGPPEGYFAIADTAYDDAADVRRSTQGFRQIKFRLTNATAPRGTPTAVQQHMTNAVVVAVVRHQTNTCYTANLMGQWQAPGKSMQTCRGPNGYVGNIDDVLKNENISTSSPCAVGSATSGISLPVGTTVDVTCTFSSAEIIPYSGTDMKLMLAVRGTLGEEDNGLIVHQIDIQEPSFAVDQNSTDFVRSQGVVYPADRVLSAAEWADVDAVCRSSTPNRINAFCQNLTYSGSIRDATAASKKVLRYQLTPGQFVRVAVLMPTYDGLRPRQVRMTSFCESVPFADVVNRTYAFPRAQLTPAGLFAVNAKLGINPAQLAWGSAPIFSQSNLLQTTWGDYLETQAWEDWVIGTRNRLGQDASQLNFSATNPGAYTATPSESATFLHSRGQGSVSPCVSPINNYPASVQDLAQTEIAKLGPLFPTSTPTAVEFCTTTDCHLPRAVCTGGAPGTCSLVQP
jgi:hypothetical protein